VALQEDGKIVVVGYSFNTGGQSCFTVLRYGTDGSLDTSFADSGKVVTSVAKNGSADSVAMQGDGKIVVAGNSFIDGGNNDFAVVRYNANGTLDTTFNQTGKATADFGAHDLGHSVAVHSDGRIVVAGYTTSEAKNNVRWPALKRMGIWTRVSMAPARLRPISAATEMLKARVWQHRVMEKPLLWAMRLLAAFNGSRLSDIRPMELSTPVSAALVAY
jgi:hypothetical protein